MELKDGEVRIHNKIYKTVALRIIEFRDNYTDYCIETDLVSNGDSVVMKAIIKNDKGVVVATGYAEELRNSTNINKTSALENCETSAIGRALASLGLAGTEYASADEVVNAITNQKIIQANEYLVKHSEAIRENINSIYVIKNEINLEDHTDNSTAAEAWFELDNEAKTALWVAPTKGGVFTTKEREVIQSSEFRKSHYG